MSSCAPSSVSIWQPLRFHPNGRFTRSFSFGHSPRSFPQSNRSSAMKITRVEPIHLRLPQVNDRCDGSQETLVVKVHTDAGITGIGEVDSSSSVAKAIIEAPLSHKISRGLAEC